MRPLFKKGISNVPKTTLGVWVPVRASLGRDGELTPHR
jgi:hypothetical protein